MITIQDMVQREIHCCLSSLVATLAGGSGAIERTNQRLRPEVLALQELADQALELASPIPDYEEAAIQAGWKKWDTLNIWERGADPKNPDATAQGAEQACEMDGLDPYDREVFEHWAVSEWLASKLITHGEKVDSDFAGLIIWARTTTGQAIHADGVIEAIYREAMA